MPGSDTSQGGVTQYRVVETIASGNYQQTVISGKGTQQEPYTITNRMITSYSVEKIWKLDGSDPLKGAEVTVGLWRQAGNGGMPERVSKTDKTQSCDSLTNQYTLTLSSGKLSGSFTGLPKYDKTGAD